MNAAVGTAATSSYAASGFLMVCLGSRISVLPRTGCVRTFVVAGRSDFMFINFRRVSAANLLFFLAHCVCVRERPPSLRARFSRGVKHKYLLFDTATVRAECCGFPIFGVVPCACVPMC